MKKLLLVVCLILAMAIPVMAEEEFQWIGTDVDITASGHYFTNKSLKGKFAGGLGVEVIQLFDNLVGIRGEIVKSIDEDDDAPSMLAGVGGTLKLHNAINKIGGKSIIPDNWEFGLAASIDVTHGLDNLWEEIKNPYLSALLIGIKF